MGIGASEGGLAAIKKMVNAIPATANSAYIIQLAGIVRTDELAKVVSQMAAIPVHEITGIQPINPQPGNLYILPGNKMAVAQEGQLQLIDKKTDDTANLTIDVFFKSLAQLYKSFAVGIVLSGEGFDGTDGLKILRECGAITYAEEPGLAEFPSMPASAISAGAVDYVLPAEDMVAHLVEIKKTYQANHANLDSNDIPDEDGIIYRQIMMILKKRNGHDLGDYKQATIRRRIARRMVATGKGPHLSAYLHFIGNDEKEQDDLFRDILISVTYFFRDPDTFRELEEAVFPALLKNNKQPGLIRIWVTGCSTGEEAYSMAICLHEFLKVHSPGTRIRIFASDIAGPSILKARKGVYSSQSIKNIPPHLVEEYFEPSGNDFQVSKAIREMCVFAVHNFLKDPPFSKIDLVSCRNVLIYMEAALQKKALSIFHYALHPNGILLLGRSESTACSPDLFSVITYRHKIYTSNNVFPNFLHILRNKRESLAAADNLPNSKTDFLKAESFLFARYTPPAIIVNARFEIIYCHGDLGKILQLPEGKSVFNILEVARPEFVFELRNCLHRSLETKMIVHSDKIPVTEHDRQIFMSMEIIPMQKEEELHLLVTFNNAHTVAGPGAFERLAGKLTKSSAQVKIKQQEEEILHLKEDMQAIANDQEVYTEELQSANEELLTSGEELQILNEELAASKLELKATNEELQVFNKQLIERNEQSFTAQTYAEAIVSSIDDPIIILDHLLQVKNANAAFYAFFNTKQADTEQQPFFELPGIDRYDTELRYLVGQTFTTKATLNNYELAITIPPERQRIVLLSAAKLSTDESSEPMLMVVFRDITDLRMAAQLKESEERFRLATELTGLGNWDLNLSSNRMINSESTREILGLREEESSTNKFLSLVHPEDFSIARQAFDNALLSRHLLFEVRIRRHDNTMRWIRVNGHSLLDKQQKPYRLLGTIMDITGQKNHQVALDETEQRFKVIADAAPVMIWLADITGSFNFFNKGWLSFTGRTMAGETGRGWMESIHEKDRAAFTKSFDSSFSSGASFFEELRLKRGDGKYRWISIHGISRCSPGNVFEGYIGAATDITDQKKFSAELATQVQQQTLELKKSHELLEEKNKELERSNSELASFSFIASHDLQEPLRKIQTFSTRILGSDKDKLSEKSKDYFGRLTNAARSMQQLIDDILDYSKVNFSRNKPELISLNVITDNVVSGIQHILQEKNARVEVGKLPALKIIPIQFTQLFTNLILNAIKYSKVEVAPHISIQAVMAAPGEIDLSHLSKERHYWKISVADNGIGFESVYEKSIFEMFQRLHSKTEYRGTGMGLAICKKIVENNDGYITASGEPGVGATFNIYLPADGGTPSLA